MDWRALTVVSLDFSQRIRKPVISPFSPTSRVLQKMVGQFSFSIRGLANCSKVSLRISTWVAARSSSRNSLAPGRGSILAMVAWISLRPRPCSRRMFSRKFISLL